MFLHSIYLSETFRCSPHAGLASGASVYFNPICTPLHTGLMICGYNSLTCIHTLTLPYNKPNNKRHKLKIHISAHSGMGTKNPRVFNIRDTRRSKNMV